jgi:cytoskeletal protein CcmA (bactofilin family)
MVWTDDQIVRISNGMRHGRHQITAFLGQDTEFEGSLSFKGTVRIDGRFKGDVKTQGTLIAGQTAVMECDIRAATVIVSGEIRGHIIAGEKIEILPPARVFGDIEAPSVIINNGVVFKGNCRTEIQEEVVENKVAFLQKASETKNGR